MTHAKLQPVVRVAAGHDGESERTGLHHEHRFGPEVLAVHLEGMQTTQVHRGELSQFLAGSEHVRADARHVEVVGHVEELTESGFVTPGDSGS